MSKVLLELSEENLETGLRGIPVGYCVTSTVDPQKGLFYVGTALSEMADWEPIRVIDLLYHGVERNAEDIHDFEKELQSRALSSPKLLDHIQALPREGHPMKLFAASLLFAGIFEGQGDYREDLLNIIAKIPFIAASVINHHAGWEQVESSQPNLGYMENFNSLLNVPSVDKDMLLKVFKQFNILHYDHGGGNCSAFTGKTVASSLEDMYGSSCAAMCALAGPRHGKANQDCLQFVHEVLDTLGEDASASDIEELIRQRLENKELIFGFGHAVLRVEDPRATIFYASAKKHYSNNPLVKIALLLRDVAPKVLKENPKISNPYPNVDAISGTLLSSAGFPYPEYYTVLFGLSRIIGIAIQIAYERCEARNGKGLPIVRPKYFFRKRKPSGKEIV